jgi:hypothetical protein
MIALRKSLRVSIQFILSVQIEETNLSFYCRFYFHIFALFTPCRPHSSLMGVSIIPPCTSLLAFNRFLIFIQIHNTKLSYGCRIIFPFSHYISLRFGSLYHHGFGREVTMPKIKGIQIYIYIDPRTSVYEPYTAV